MRALVTGARPPQRSRRRVAGALTAVLVPGLALVGGCGDTDPGARSAGGTTLSSPTAAGPSPSAVALDPDQVTIVSETGVGGEVSSVAEEISDDETVQLFGRQFTDTRMGDRIAQVTARTDIPAGLTLYGAVVALGCDVPPGVVVASGDGGVEITAQEVTDPTRECLAPVTSVALVLVDSRSQG